MLFAPRKSIVLFTSPIHQKNLALIARFKGEKIWIDPQVRLRVKSQRDHFRLNFPMGSRKFDHNEIIFKGSISEIKIDRNLKDSTQNQLGNAKISRNLRHWYLWRVIYVLIRIFLNSFFPCIFPQTSSRFVCGNFSFFKIRIFDTWTKPIFIPKQSVT